MAPKKKGTKVAAEEVKAEEVKAEVKEAEAPEAKEAKAEDVEMKEAPKEEAPKEEAPIEEAKEEAKEEGEAKAEAPAKAKEPEKPKELEQDASDDKRQKVSASTVDINASDATLNVMPTANGQLLMALSEGGFQYLLAGTRTTVGLKSGRYMFEVKIVETHVRPEPPNTQGGNQARVPMPKQLVRLGLSHAGSSLFMADGTSENISFDSEGFFVFEKNRKKVAAKFGRDVTVALLVNLEEGSPNANTISLFREGVRISEPQAIPEKLRGKPLYPTITYKGVTLQVNFGPVARVPLPFRCHMLAEAALADVEVATTPKPKGGRYEVLFPVGLPEQGFFDWVDTFLEQHPEYTELSDRKILDWAAKSGLWRPKGAGSSNDKPDMKFGIPLMDDLSVRRLLSHIAPTARRSYVVPELKANLVATDRKESIMKFVGPTFKKTATVIVGEPTAEHKAKVHALMLAEKKAKLEAERKKKAAEEERNRLLEEKKKKAEEAKKANAAGLKKKAEGDVEEKEEAKEEKEDVKEDSRAEEEEAAVELTEEERALWHRRGSTPDVDEKTLSRSYADFTLPTQEEGFDEISYIWQSEAASTKLLKEWIFAKKLTQRVEDLQPGQWFKDEWSKWTKCMAEWRKRQTEWKDPVKKKALLKAREEAKKKEAEEKGEEAPKEDKMEIDVEDIDVFSVDDVMDLGNGEPLFANFVYEDWALLGARFELHLLLHAFKKDLNDADRPSFTEKDLPFYYNKYFKRTFNLKGFGVDKLAGFVELVKDTLTVNVQNSFVETVLGEDTPTANFVKLAEDDRRERQRRLDAGDETAELKFPRNAPTPPPRQPGAWQGGAAAPSAGVRPAAAVGGRGPPPQPARYGSAAPGNGTVRPYGSAYSSAPLAGQKRAYTPPATSAYVAKQPRTSSYGTLPARML